MLKKLLQFLIKHYPETCADIFCQDFLGVVPTKEVDRQALQFMAKNRGVFEPFLITLSHTLQRENTLSKEHKPQWYAGALFVIRLFYAQTIKDLPYQFPADNKPKEKLSKPQDDVDNFILKIKEKEHGQENSKVPQGQGGKVQNVNT